MSEFVITLEDANADGGTATAGAAKDAKSAKPTVKTFDTKTFDTLRFERLDLRDVLLRALDRVRHFIIKKRLILVGGMAIDYNLRLRGSRLYDDNVIPDYDFYSPDNAADAYELGSELCRQAFPEVDVITAIHTTTMKVRVGGYVVADITYVPREVFDRIETLTYKNMRVVHPYYTVMDQTSSLSCPYENPPNEVVFARWSKDVKRSNMLLEAYPIREHVALGAKSAKGAGDAKMYAVALPDFSKRDGILNGWAALAFHQSRSGVTRPTVALAYTAGNANVKIPVQYATVMSTRWRDWVRRGAKCDYYNPELSYFRRVVNHDDRVEVYDTQNVQVTRVDTGEPVASFMAVFCYFMYRYLFTVQADDKRNAALALHCIAEMLETGYPESLDVTPYGDVSWNVSTQYAVLNIVDPERTRTWKPFSQKFDTKNECHVTRTFQPENSPLFTLDGKRCEPWQPDAELDKTLKIHAK